MFIQTEDTPNPHTLKFLPGQEIAPDEPRDFPTPEHADTSLLARELFRLLLPRERVGLLLRGADAQRVGAREQRRGFLRRRAMHNQRKLGKP